MPNAQLEREATRPVIAPQLRASVDVRRLRNIAANLLVQWSDDLRPEIEDLVSAGWLGYRAAEEREPDAVYPSFYYSCARFAMLDEIRKWAGATTRMHPRDRKSVV